MEDPSLSGTTPSVGELSADFAKQKRPKSPPLAFEKTSNDSLAPLNAPHSSAPEADGDPLSSVMGRFSPPRGGSEHEWQVVVDQQAAAIQLLHDAFAAERQCWSLEKDRLYQRIAKLERLLRAGDGYSPARSPSLSPLNLSNITSPQSRASTNLCRLPSIAEDEDTPSLSQRRPNAPQSIDISSAKAALDEPSPSVSFQEGTPAAITVEEIPRSPNSDPPLSPPAFINRVAAGHTPLRAPRPFTPPPLNSLTFDGIEDTPTRNNTHANTGLTKTSSEEEEKELKGPLNMPELPNKPNETNFTLEALSKRLEQIEKNPDEGRPMVFQESSPGLASPAGERERSSEAPIAPVSTCIRESSASELSSNAMSSAVLSPSSKDASRDPAEEDPVQAAFENGGIKLKKKVSTNFGAPFGSLGGFGRKPSVDR